MLQLLEGQHCTGEAVADVCLQLGLDGVDLVERLLHLDAESLDHVGDARDFGVHGSGVHLCRGLGQFVADLLAHLVECRLSSLTSVLDFFTNFVELVHGCRGVGFARHLSFEHLDIVHEDVEVLPGGPARFLDFADLADGPEAYFVQ